MAVQEKVVWSRVDPTTIVGEPPEQIFSAMVVLEMAGTGLTSAVNAVLAGFGHPAGTVMSTASA